MTELKITKGSANVFEDLGCDVQESQNLLLRSQTMIALVQWFEASGMTQAIAAKTLGITQPRFNQLLKGKIEIFSLDALVNMAQALACALALASVLPHQFGCAALQRTSLLNQASIACMLNA